MSAAIHRDEAGALRASGDKRAPSTQTPARHGEKRLPAARSGAVASDWGTDSVREWCLKLGDAHAMTTESGRPPAILCCLRRAARASDGASTHAPVKRRSLHRPLARAQHGGCARTKAFRRFAWDRAIVASLRQC